MIIKKLTDVDAKQYQKLIVQALTVHPESFRIGIQDVRQKDNSSLAFENDDSFILGAFDENETLVGAVSFKRERGAKMRHKGLIYRMYVAAEQAGKGIGRRLLQSAIERARKFDGLEQINLTVVATNERAKGLYYSAGFVSFSLEKQAIKIDCNYFDEETMKLLLTLLEPQK